MKYPDNIKTKKARLAYFFYYHLYTFEKGKGEVIGRLFSTYTEFGVTILLLDKFGINPTWVQYATVIFFIIVIFYIIGKFYMRYNIDKINNQISNERNQFLHDIHKSVVKKGEEF